MASAVRYTASLNSGWTMSMNVGRALTITLADRAERQGAGNVPDEGGVAPT